MTKLKEIQICEKMYFLKQLVFASVWGNSRTCTADQPRPGLAQIWSGDPAVAPRWLRGGPAVVKEAILEQGCFWGAKTSGFIDW